MSAAEGYDAMPKFSPEREALEQAAKQAHERLISSLRRLQKQLHVPEEDLIETRQIENGVAHEEDR